MVKAVFRGRPDARRSSPSRPLGLGCFPGRTAIRPTEGSKAAVGTCSGGCFSKASRRCIRPGGWPSSAISYPLLTGAPSPPRSLTLRPTEWVVYAKRPFAGPAAVLAYLSRYTHRVAISNSRLIASDDHSVTFRWKDYRSRGGRPAAHRIKAMTLPVDEFIRRFLMHVLPNGFHRIRHYGLFASPRRAANIAHLRELLANADDASQPFGDAGMGVADAASADLADAFAIAQICPCCGGRMSVVETFARGAQPQKLQGRRRQDRPRHDRRPDPRPRSRS